MGNFALADREIPALITLIQNLKKEEEEELLLPLQFYDL
jgi:hypothetical protein